ncbi:MAG: hypothetical protein M1814_004143 [Vezdaea aestivalis]|nr:MAG: hypothetical protein M1814_004143 [Vezdaea aestivalis]
MDHMQTLRGLEQDLLVAGEGRLESSERLCQELTDHITIFDDLLHKKTRNGQSRQQISTGKVNIDGNSYTFDADVKEGVVQVSDILDLDEVESAKLFLVVQSQQTESQSLIELAVVRFHDYRRLILNVVELMLRLSRAPELDDYLKSNLANAIATIREPRSKNTQNNPTFKHVCLSSMVSVESWIKDVHEKVQTATISGGTSLPRFHDIMSYQRKSLVVQHSSLGMILYYLTKEDDPPASDFQELDRHLASLSVYDAILVHYVPYLSILLHKLGSPSAKAGALARAQNVHRLIVDGRESNPWGFRSFQAALMAWWLCEYCEWYNDDYDGSRLQDFDVDTELETQSNLFQTALDDGAFDFALSLGADIKRHDWYDPIRHGLRQRLQTKSPFLPAEQCNFLEPLQSAVLAYLDSFVEGFIRNMPDTIRKLRDDDEEQRRLTQATNYSHDLEKFLLLISYAYERRPEAASVFWSDNESNMYGFLQWASRRPSTLWASALCEVMIAISSGLENADLTHSFLLDDGSGAVGKLRRTHSLTWSQIILELQFYAERSANQITSVQTASLSVGQILDDKDQDVEKNILLESYLRLAAHLCRDSRIAREWIMTLPGLNVVEMCLSLAGKNSTSRIRSCSFEMLTSLLPNKTQFVGELIWTALEQWTSGSAIAVAPGKASFGPNAPLWAGDRLFETISASFEEANGFVQLIDALLSPASDYSGVNDNLAFPENLGSITRMPGVDCYIDYALGLVFGNRIDLLNDDTQQQTLRLTCLDMISTCLSTFNENLVIFASSANIAVDNAMRTSSLEAYIQLHPFARTMEWMFNDKVAASLFKCAYQDAQAVADASVDSPLFLSVLRTLQLIQRILDMQPTYLAIVRPALKLKLTKRSKNVANSSLGTFEDVILNHLDFVPYLCRFCATGHNDLTTASLNLLERLSSSAKLINSTVGTYGSSRGRNKLIGKLETSGEADHMAASLIDDLRIDWRELEMGPGIPAYSIKAGILSFLNSCLEASKDSPSIAHLVLGFSCRTHSIDVTPGGRFADDQSLFHFVLKLATEWPQDDGRGFRSWLIHLRCSATRVLQTLWTAKMSSVYTFTELRSHHFLASQFTTQTLINTGTLWDERSILDPVFFAHPSASCLANFLRQRTALYEYAASELRLATDQKAQSLKATMLSTLFGSTDTTEGAMANPTIFDLFDFANLPMDVELDLPSFEFFAGIDFDVCLKTGPSGLEFYDIPSVLELLDLRRIEQSRHGRLDNAADEELLEREAELIKFSLHARNQQMEVSVERLETLTAWSQLLIIVAHSADFDAESSQSFVLQAIQVILPKLELYSSGNNSEALVLAYTIHSLLMSTKFPELKVALDGIESGDGDQLFYMFKTAIRAILLPSSTSAIRLVLYQICLRYFSLLKSDNLQQGQGQILRHIKASYGKLLQTMCDDAIGNDEACRVSALMVLDVLVALGNAEESSLLVKGLERINFTGVIVDSLKTIPSELRESDTSDTAMLLVYLQAKLTFLLRLSSSRAGAASVVNSGLFEALRQSTLFSVDPDVGVEIDNPDSLKRFYDLLLSSLRVVNAVVLSRGSQNTQTKDLARTFLSENRLSMVSVFKRHARIGGVHLDKIGDIEELLENYILLIRQTGFLEMPPSTSPPSSQRSSGISQKRVVPEDFSDDSGAFRRPRQSTISELFSAQLKPEDHEKKSSAVATRSVGQFVFGSNQRPGASSSTPISPISGTMLNNFPSKQTSAFIDLTGTPAPAGLEKPFSRLNATNRSQYPILSGPRKLIVRNVKKSSSEAAQAHCNQLRQQLDSAIESIFSSSAPAKSTEELYRASETLCSQGQAPQLASALAVRCASYTKGPLKKSAIPKNAQADAVATLKSVCDAWSTWSEQLNHIRSIYYYLDRSYLLVTKGQAVILDMGTQQFRDNVFRDDNLTSQILHGVCLLLDQERSKKPVDPLLQRSLAMIRSIGVYSKWLEQQLAQTSEAYYEKLAHESSFQPLSVYLRNCQDFMNLEEQLWYKYEFDGATIAELVALRDQAFVTGKESFLVDSFAVQQLLKNQSIADLGVLYKFLNSVSLQESLKGPWTSYILAEGRVIVKDKERQAEMIVRLLSFKSYLDRVCTEVFRKDSNFNKWFRESFGAFLNERQAGSASEAASARAGEMIAKHMDSLLRGGSKAIPAALRSSIDTGNHDTAAQAASDEDTELNYQLDLALDLFRFIEGKDVFEAFYKSDLSRRLLMSRSASSDAERSMLAKLRKECGANFTHNLEQMFKDIDLAREEMSSYKSKRRGRGETDEIDLNVNVLCASAWPSFRDIEMTIPENIAKTIGLYDVYYKSEHKGRKLHWRHDLAYCAMRATFPRGVKEIFFSAAQAVVMLQFNDVEGNAKLSYSQIKTATGLPENRLEVTLQSLACGKTRLLTKSPKGRNITDKDMFNVDLNFTDPRYRIKINQIQMKETKAENKATHEQVARDRQFETQAAIVRIMKSRKSISHAELVSEVIMQTKKRGNLDMKEIKVHIDKLIDKDYLERTEGEQGQNGYTYLA